MRNHRNKQNGQCHFGSAVSFQCLEREFWTKIKTSLRQYEWYLLQLSVRRSCIEFYKLIAILPSDSDMP